MPPPVAPEASTCASGSETSRASRWTEPPGPALPVASSRPEASKLPSLASIVIRPPLAPPALITLSLPSVTALPALR